MSRLLIGALLGFLIREAWAITRAVGKSGDRFSLAYYFSRPRNLALLALNALSTTALLFAWPDLRPFVLRNTAGLDAPAITGLMMGFFAAVAFRWIANRVGRHFGQPAIPDPEGDPMEDTPTPPVP